MFDTLWPLRLWPTRLLCSWDFPGKNPGVGSHALLQELELWVCVTPDTWMENDILHLKIQISWGIDALWVCYEKVETTRLYDPAIPLLGIHTEETRRERDTCTPMFIAEPVSLLSPILTGGFFTTSSIWEGPPQWCCHHMIHFFLCAMLMKPTVVPVTPHTQGTLTTSVCLGPPWTDPLPKAFHSSSDILLLPSPLGRQGNWLWSGKEGVWPCEEKPVQELV